jgi:hypothetical protein
MSYIRTYTGREFYPLEPRIEDIHIIDIAHALSNLCRFTGHTKHFYSVAQHSVYVSQFISYPSEKMRKIYQRYALLHDASEAYICDISRPLKSQDCFKGYLDYEEHLQNMIYRKFGLDIPTEEIHQEIKESDNGMLDIEGNQLMKGWNEQKYGCPSFYRFNNFDIPYLSPEKAETEFLSRFIEVKE